MRLRRHFVPSFRRGKQRKPAARSNRGAWRKNASWFESLEQRAMLTADLAVTSFSANGTNWLVDYNVTGSNVSAFDISIYRSTDGTTLGDLVQTQRVTASGDLQIGNGHQATIAPSFTDTDTDYFLVAVVDSGNEISESSETNNQTALAGGVFLASNGQLHIHGTSAADNIQVTQGATLGVTLNGTAYSYSLGAITGIRVRSHGGADYFTGTSATASILMHGGDGNDRIYSGAGDDTIYGDAGDDTLYGGANSSSTGWDYLYGGDGVDVIWGDTGNGTGVGWDYIDGGDGNDNIHGDGGSNVIYGNDGHDTIYGGTGDNTIYGGAGNDTIYAGSSTNTIYGGDGGDWIYGNVGNDVLYGGDGNDTINGGGGADYIYGDAGNDTVNGGPGADWIYGGSGNDILSGYTGSDFIFGEDGDDILEGGADDDSLDGGAGNDTYRFWGNYALGTDTLAETTSNGSDTLDFSSATVAGIGLDLSLTGTTDQPVSTYLRLILSNANAIENVVGSAGDDYIIGNGLNNTIYGGGGDDWLEGGAGDDTLYGGDGSDTVFGEAGNDTIYGGAGDDYLYGDTGDCDCSSNDADTIYGEDGNDHLKGDGDVDHLDGGAGIDDFIDVQTQDFVADRPVISGLMGDHDSNTGTLIISGHVTDDNDTEGLTVYFGGVLDGYGYTAIVDENGDFELIIDDTFSGTVTATTIDNEGLVSNEATITI